MAVHSEEVGRRRLVDIADYLQILESDADAQNSWLHPCGWTREEPREHLGGQMCAGTVELVESFECMRPLWRDVVERWLTPAVEASLDATTHSLSTLPSAALSDEIAALDHEAWAVVRAQARSTRASVTAALREA